MAGRKIRDEKDARSCIAAAKAAELSPTELARMQGIDGRSLFAWGRKLARKDKVRGGKLKKSRRNPGRLVELIPSEMPERAPAPYLVRCGPFSVEIDDHFNEATLARLLRVMVAC